MAGLALIRIRPKREEHPLADLYQRFGHVVFRRAKQILGHPAEADDVVQELFKTLVERPEQLKRARSVQAWFYGATTHACLNRIRNQRTRTRLLETHGLPAEARDPVSQDPTAEVALITRQILSQLPMELAEVIVYYAVDQMTHAEIAEVMACSRRHIGNMIERARAAAQAILTELPEVPA